MSDHTCFKTQISNGVAHIIMSRGNELNTMTKLFWKELPEIIKAIDKNADARVILLRGEGKHFSAGMDLGNFVKDGSEKKKKDPSRMREAFYHELLELQGAFTALEKCRMPTIASIQGACVGGAIDMAAACDMRYCSTDAFYKIAEVDIGIAADVGTLQRLPTLMPLGAVRELAYTGRKFDSAEAQQLGFVERVYKDHDQLLEETTKLAEEIASKSPLVTSVIKKQINYARDNSVDDALDYHAIWNSALISSSDMESAMKAYMEKVSGDFEDLEPKKSFWEKQGLIS